jgi:hypothetical protein
MFKVTITRDGADEPFELTTTTRDVLRWEKTNKKHKSLGSLEKDIAIEDVYMMAFYAAQRLGLWSGSLPEFESECDIDFEEVEDEGPTQPGR